MPTYSMKNITTDEEFEVVLKYLELENYLNENKHIKQIFTRFPGTVDPVNVGVRKTDDGFKDALREVKKAHRKNTINV